MNIHDKRRIYVDLDVKVADKAKERAHDLRLPQKRYIEALIEKDCLEASKKSVKKKA